MFVNIKSLCDYRRSYFPSILKKLGLGKKVIVISEDEVVQFSVSSHKQIIFSIFLVCLVGWSIFATGAYFTTKEQLKKKNFRYSNSEYVIGQLNDDLETFRSIAQNVNSEKRELLEKVAYLEKQIKYNEEHKTELIAAIKDTTEKKISAIEEIIDGTGVKVGHIFTKKPTPPNSDESYSGQGGPYLPEFDENSILTDGDKELLGKISYLSDLKDAFDNIPFLKPMDRYYITSDFGSRIDPFNKKKTSHHGIDLAWRKNSEIYATAPGKVIYAGKMGAYGYVVIINHKNDFQTRYAHLKKGLKVKKGDKIKEGQIIGIQGNTGRSTGDHLHYEVRFKNEAVDPKKFFGKKNGVF